MSEPFAARIAAMGDAARCKGSRLHLLSNKNKRHAVSLKRDNHRRWFTHITIAPMRINSLGAIAYA